MAHGTLTRRGLRASAAAAVVAAMFADVGRYQAIAQVLDGNVHRVPALVRTS
jgi:hypothetical protein